MPPEGEARGKPRQSEGWGRSEHRRRDEKKIWTKGGRSQTPKGWAIQEGWNQRPLEVGRERRRGVGGDRGWIQNPGGGTEEVPGPAEA